MRTCAPNSSFGWFRVSFDDQPQPLPSTGLFCRLTPTLTSAARLGNPFFGLIVIRLANRGK